MAANSVRRIPLVMFGQDGFENYPLESGKKSRQEVENEILRVYQSTGGDVRLIILRWSDNALQENPDTMYVASYISPVTGHFAHHGVTQQEHNDAGGQLAFAVPDLRVTHGMRPYSLSHPRMDGVVNPVSAWTLMKRQEAKVLIEPGSGGSRHRRKSRKHKIRKHKLRKYTQRR
jgi:hypothetical protein